MDTDIPLSPDALAGVIAGPAAVAWLVLGLTACVACGLMTYSAVYARVERSAPRREVVQGLVGAFVAAVAACILLFVLLRPWVYGLSAMMGQGPGAPAHLPANSSLYYAALGSALWPALLSAGLGMTFALFRRLRPDQPDVARRLGQSLAAVLAFWVPIRQGETTNANGAQDEPEFELMLASGEEVEAEEREYIGNILELGDTTASEVMTPRTDVVALDSAWGPERIIQTVAEARFSRFPVYEESIDNIVGVLHLRDLLEFLARTRGSAETARIDLRGMLIEPNFIPASKKIDDVLRELQRLRGHMAIALDEYGGTAGILTIEDLLEEIVGEIQDEHDDESKLVHKREDGTYIVHAQLSLDELNRELDTGLQADDVETLGGFIADALGRIPVQHDAVEHGGLRFTVLSVDRNRIGRVHVEHLAEAADSTV